MLERQPQTGERLPMSVTDLTAQWLTGALSRRHPGVVVEALEVREVIWGTASKVLVRARYQSHPGAEGPPEALCIKGGFAPELRELGLGSSYRREAEFYALLAPRLDLDLPGIWYCGTDDAAGQGIVVMDDLAEAGARFGDCSEPLTVDQVAVGLENLAVLHAFTWGADAARFPWLSRINPVREVGAILLGPDYWERHFTSPHAPTVPTELLDRERMAAAFTSWWRLSEQSPRVCITHNDPHIGNTYTPVGGRLTFLDWQAMCAAPALDDVAYFVGGGLSVPDRRNHERSLLRHYSRALAGHGGPSLDAEHLWLDYRVHQMHGFFWALTGPHMQCRARVAAMTERHLAAIEDHDTVRLLLAAD